MANDKTNVMRILDKEQIEYTPYFYQANGAVDGVSVAEKIGKSVDIVFKTLVTKGTQKDYYVFVIPVQKELNLKLAAKAVAEKSVSMIPVNDINKVTGYIRGGCSPIGMKKQFKTVIDKSCENCEKIIFSAGKIGAQVEMNPKDLIRLINADTEHITDNL